MGISVIAASLALFGASASAMSTGSASVVNQCNYDVFLSSVPAAGGGQQQVDQSLASGASWTQPWTQLTNGNGWSIKLSKGNDMSNILQYEYTFHNDGIIWYDLSCVNGNPWDKDWEISSSSGTCSPKQQAYRYATDDAYGEQSCPQDASIVVTLCSGTSADNGSAVSKGSGSGSGTSSSVSAVPYSAPAPVAAPSSVAAPAQSAPAQSSPAAIQFNWNNADAAASTLGDAKNNVAPSPTTFATVTTAAVPFMRNGPDGEVFTDVEIVTSTVTAYAPGKRHQHEHHARGHQHHAA